VLIIPVITSFGLIFKDKFRYLNLSALDATLIMNLNSALGMTLGLFNGVLLNCFGYRKIALLGGTLFSGGLIATSWANSFWHFIITYSIITCKHLDIFDDACSSSFLHSDRHGIVLVIFFIRFVHKLV
jgi:MFS family permease